MSERWLITGAGSGIGQGLVRALHASGRTVTACFRSVEERELAGFEASATMDSLCFDVRDDRQVRAAGDAMRGQVIDVLVACAAVFGERRNAVDVVADEALDLYSCNALGPLRTLQAFLPQLRASARPRVAFLSSELGSMHVRGSHNLAYRASKAALNKMVQALAEELCADGIAMAAIEPGWVRTEMGGPSAPLPVATSVEGIVRCVQGLRPSREAAFVDYLGQEVPW